MGEKSKGDRLQDIRKARGQEKLTAAKRAALQAGLSLEQIANAAGTTRLDELRKMAKGQW